MALAMGLFGGGTWFFAGARTGFAMWGDSYPIPEPLIPWVMLVIGPGALAAAFFALSLRHFTFVAWTGAAIIALAGGALVVGGSPKLLVFYLVVFAVIVRKRSLFID